MMATSPLVARDISGAGTNLKVGGTGSARKC